MQFRELSKHLIGQAVLAPSSHNTQPWTFELADNLISIHADRTRSLPVNNPDDRELTISCGAALLNLRAAAAALGIGLDIRQFPNRDDRDLLAEVRLEGELDKALASLSGAIAQRRTYRQPFEQQDPTANTVEYLKAAASAEGAWFEPLDQRRRRAAAALVAEGNRSQWADPAWRQELAAWMHHRRNGDGLSINAVVLPFAKSIVRAFDLGPIVNAQDQRLLDRTPLLGVLGTTADDIADWLRAGQALERLLLTAAQRGLQASFLNQPLQVAHLRPRFREICATDGHPQLLLRIGYPAGNVPSSTRRKLEDVLEHHNR